MSLIYVISVNLTFPLLNASLCIKMINIYEVDWHLGCLTNRGLLNIPEHILFQTDLLLRSEVKLWLCKHFVLKWKNFFEHITCMGLQRKNLSPQQDSSLWPFTHQSDALTTELWRDSWWATCFTKFICDTRLPNWQEWDRVERKGHEWQESRENRGECKRPFFSPVTSFVSHWRACSPVTNLEWLTHFWLNNFETVWNPKAWPFK